MLFKFMTSVSNLINSLEIGKKERERERERERWTMRNKISEAKTGQ